MEILQLKYFCHAAKTENLSHTAQHFIVPTSCISVSIKKLENELGVKLFDRTANKIKLNEYGKIFLQALEKSEILFKKAKADIFDLMQAPFGEIKLLILTNREKATKVISEFNRKYPKISFTISHQYHNELSKSNEYDILITDQDIASEHYNQAFWLTEEIFLAVHKNHVLSGKSFISSNQLKDENFILMQKNSSLRNFSDNFFEKNGIIPNVVIECDDPQYVRKYLKMGLGVTFFPEISWKEEISDDFSLLRIDKGLFRKTFIYANKSASNVAILFAQMLQNT